MQYTGVRICTTPATAYHWVGCPCSRTSQHGTQKQEPAGGTGTPCLRPKARPLLPPPAAAVVCEAAVRRRERTFAPAPVPPAPAPAPGSGGCRSSTSPPSITVSASYKDDTRCVPVQTAACMLWRCIVLVNKYIERPCVGCKQVLAR